MKRISIIICVLLMTMAGYGATSQASAATWGCTVAAPFGYCFGATSDTTVFNNVENSGAPGYISQTLNADSTSHWEAVADMAAGNKQVISYPHNETSWGNYQPITSFTALDSAFTIGLPGYSKSEDAEAAYDIWVNGPANPSDPQEVMIWVDNQNQTPAGYPNVVGTVVNDGVTYRAYQYNDNATVSLVAEANRETGTVGIKSLLGWVQENFPYKGDVDLSQLQFGFEICSTVSVPKGYFVTGYTLGG